MTQKHLKQQSHLERIIDRHLNFLYRSTSVMLMSRN